MKLVRWTLAGASFYVIYKYAIGKKARGEQVFASPENEGGSTVSKGGSAPSADKPD